MSSIQWTVPMKQFEHSHHQPLWSNQELTTSIDVDHSSPTVLAAGDIARHTDIISIEALCRLLREGMKSSSLLEILYEVMPVSNCLDLADIAFGQDFFSSLFL